VSEAEEAARSEGKTLSAVIQDALRLSRAARLKDEFRVISATGFSRTAG
jgi:hypothetical protein